jgi:hypothetical protein
MQKKKSLILKFPNNVLEFTVDQGAQCSDSQASTISNLSCNPLNMQTAALNFRTK